VFAHQQGAQNIIDQAYDEYAEQNQGHTLPDGAADQEIDSHGYPDYGGAHGGQQRKEGHQHTPQQCALYAQEPEHGAAQRALGGRHHNIALYSSAHHGGELTEQMLLVLFTKGDQVFAVPGQLATVAQQKEQQIQHDAHADQELEGVLANVHGLRSQELATLQSHVGQFFA